MVRCLFRFAVLMSLLAFGGTALAAVTGESLINGQDYTVTNPGNQVVPLRVGAGADNTANPSFKLGVLPCVVDNAFTWVAGRVAPCVVNTNGALITTATLGGTTTPADAFTNPTNAGTAYALLGGFNGVTWDRLQVDASKFLKVNVAAALPAGANTIGAVTQASGPWTVTGTVAPADAFTNPTNAGTAYALLGGFNGVTWDRLQVDASKFLKVNVAAALPAGTNSIGAVVATTQENSGGSFTSLNALADASVRQVSAAATANVVTLDLRNLNQVIAIVFSCSAGTATLAVESSVDNFVASDITIDSVAAAASGVKLYVGSSAGASTAVSPVAFRYLKVTVGSCGVANTSTLTVTAK